MGGHGAFISILRFIPGKQKFSGTESLSDRGMQSNAIDAKAPGDTGHISCSLLPRYGVFLHVPRYGVFLRYSSGTGSTADARSSVHLCYFFPVSAENN